MICVFCGRMKRRVNMSIHPSIEAAAEQLMIARKFSSMSSMVEQLIREEYERRVEPMVIKQPAESGAKRKPSG